MRAVSNLAVIAVLPRNLQNLDQITVFSEEKVIWDTYSVQLASSNKKILSGFLITVYLLSFRQQYVRRQTLRMLFCG